MLTGMKNEPSMRELPESYVGETLYPSEASWLDGCLAIVPGTGLPRPCCWSVRGCQRSIPLWADGSGRR